MNAKEFEKKLSALPVVEPDAEDLRAMKSIDRSDASGIELEEFKAALEYSGKLSLRIPKSLHQTLSEQAKREGVSLNQYALYKLSQPTQQPPMH